MPENALAWDVLMAMQDQVAVVPLGGVLGFRLEALSFVFDVLVPVHRRHETFVKFQILKSYALGKMGGSGGRKNTDDTTEGGRGRKRPRS
jgi:hypothetical protein